MSVERSSALSLASPYTVRRGHTDRSRGPQHPTNSPYSMSGLRNVTDASWRPKPAACISLYKILCEFCAQEGAQMSESATDGQGKMSEGRLTQVQVCKFLYRTIRHTV